MRESLSREVGEKVSAVGRGGLGMLGQEEERELLLPSVLEVGGAFSRGSRWMEGH